MTGGLGCRAAGGWARQRRPLRSRTAIRLRGSVFGGGVRRLLLGLGHSLQFRVDLADSLTRGCYLVRLRERLAEAGGRVLDLPPGAFGVIERAGLALFETAETVLQPGHQSDRVGVGQLVGGDLDAGARRAFQRQGNRGAAQRPVEPRGQREAAQLARPQSTAALTVELGEFPPQDRRQGASRADGSRPSWRTCRRGCPAAGRWRRQSPGRARSGWRRTPRSW